MLTLLCLCLSMSWEAPGGAGLFSLKKNLLSRYLQKHMDASLGHCLKLEDSAIYPTTINSAPLWDFPVQSLTCGMSFAETIHMGSEVLK